MVRIAKTASIIKCGLIASMISAGDCPAQEANVAHVIAVRGFVTANVAGEQTRLLDVLDGIRERTRIELRANSELSICHYPTRTQVTLKGPLHAEVWADSLTVDNAAAVARSSTPCAGPELPSRPGGQLFRGLPGAR